MPRLLITCILLTVNTTIIVGVLRREIPIFIDGGGTMPSLYWGDVPAPSLGEYYQSKIYFDFLFLMPYVATSTLMTMIAWVARAALSWIRPELSRRFAPAALTTMCGLILAILLWDATSVLGLWDARILILAPGLSESLGPLLRICLSASVLGGLTEVVRCRYLAPSGKLAAP